ncbi:hypothetical protein CHP00488 [gut metagenome]|uniref:HD domain-containing protein n=1 Tax=gut metagenome TaxID=749906 RepID=J9H3T4_9ZZZZ
MNVKNMAVELANKYGADPQKAAMAAILHDSLKERPKEELLQMLKENAIIASDALSSPPPVWHGPCAAIAARRDWGIEDEEILNAIWCHTTGRPGMTKLDKILYLSDMISAEREYPEVEELRMLAQKDLDEAVITAVRYNVRWIKEAGKPVDPLSLKTLEYLEKEEHSNE